MLNICYVSTVWAMNNNTSWIKMWTMCCLKGCKTTLNLLVLFVCTALNRNNIANKKQTNKQKELMQLRFIWACFVIYIMHTVDNVMRGPSVMCLMVLNVYIYWRVWPIVWLCDIISTIIYYSSHNCLCHLCDYNIVIYIMINISLWQSFTFNYSNLVGIYK